MAIATIGGEATSVHRPPDEVDLRAGQREGSSTALGPAAAKALQGPPQSAAPQRLSLAPSPFYRAMPAAGAFALRPEAIAPALRGYAPGTATQKAALAVPSPSTRVSGAAKSSSSSKSSTAKTTSKTATSKSSTPSELAFLDDKHTSIEDKLFQFMVLMTRKNDQELVNAMKEYEAKKATGTKASSSSSSSSQAKPASDTQHESSGGGLFGLLGDALGGIGKALVGGAESLVKDLGGPVLAGVATAVGLPFLAPVALKVGGDLGAGIIEGVASSVGLGKTSSTSSGSARSSAGTPSSGGSSTKTASSSSAGSASTAAGGEFDEKLEMFKLQRLVEKQNAMFSALTNAMKSMHDAEMTAVQNIR